MPFCQTDPFADCDDSGAQAHDVPPDLGDAYEGFLEAFARLTGSLTVVLA